MLNRAAKPAYETCALPSTPKPDLAASLAPWILAFAITFNFGLCALHTNLRAVSALEVILVEASLIAATAAIGLLRKDILRSPWLAVLILQLIWLLFLWIARDQVLMKPVRDAIIMPLFVLLGMNANRIDIGQLLVRTNLAILAFAMAEALFLDAYLSACDVIDYFISKGSTPEFQRTINDTNLFVSGIRPDGRFLVEIPGVHRISSIFLEPVSLGMYGAICGMAFLAFSQQLGRTQVWLGVASSFLLIWLADGRLALGVLLLCLLIHPLAGRMDARLAVWTFPASFLLGWLIVTLGLGSEVGDGTTARLHSTFGVLSRVDETSFYGLGGLGSESTVDTGLGYLVETQGVLGVLILWLVPIFMHRRLQGPARSYVLFLSIYLSSAFLFSAAIYTVKTAALLWFLYGYAIASEYRAPNRPTVHRPHAPGARSPIRESG